jgi:hypothetical protein
VASTGRAKRRAPFIKALYFLGLDGTMEIKNEEELKMEFSKSSENDDLAQHHFNKTIYAQQKDFMALVNCELKFEPYISLAKQCGMSSMVIKKSSNTNRFYFGNLNIAGHGPAFELRPIKLQHVLDLSLIKTLFSNHAYELGRVIDRESNYKI